ncbi:MAG: DUF1326 domain-containing protein [Candidatus Hydrogenedentes bacterium]|nr:DUF1326 domain-containing protein [Candidatus Hydrogenedentota bacterium]
MGSMEWSIQGPSFSNCNCDWGCPCQFNALPTHGFCCAFVAMRIDKGHFDGAPLDGIRWACTLRWPGPIHEGNGEAQVIVDQEANEAQRHAVISIVKGEHTEPGATIFQVFSATLNKVHDPLFLPIDFACDVHARTAKVTIKGLVEASGNPILNPVTDLPHRVLIKVPEGFEYDEAEVGTGITKATGAVALDLNGTHSHFTVYHMTNKGVVH